MREDLGLFIDTSNGEWIDLGLPNSKPGENAIMVPQVSVVRRPAGDVVYVIDAGMAEERLIERGLRNGSLVEVRSGLTGGERVAVDGAGFLTHGTRVTEVEG